MANAAAGQNNFQQLARFLYEDREGCALILRAMQGADDLTPAERPRSFDCPYRARSFFATTQGAALG